MQAETRVVLVTGVGGNVAQGVLRNLRADFPELRIVGVDINQVTAGHHFCDAAYQVPYAYDASYAERLGSIVEKENVELIIPCTDHETLHAAQVPECRGKVIGNPAETAAIFLDKYQTAERFRSEGIPFADSLLPSQYDGRWEKVVLKPRDGRGSRDVYIDPPSPESFDDSFVVQRFLEGPEITAAFYVRKCGTLHGIIVFQRELRNGMTERCSVVMEHAPGMQKIAEQMTQAFSLRGPCNIQAKVLKDASIVPFEINARYSGTNSIRSQLGFCDVRYGIQEYLLEQTPEAPSIKNGCAIRLMMDIVYPDGNLSELAAGDSNSFIF